MGNLFSTNKKRQITDVDRAVLSLKTQRRKLVEYQRKVESVIERETAAARELLKEKKKERALLCLKKKKYQEQLLQKVDAWIFNVEEQITNIEVVGRQKDVFDSLKSGHSTIKELQSEISIDDVQKLMDETAEAKEYQDEVNRILGEKLSSMEEDEVNAEFDKLEEELLDVDLPPVPVVPEQKLPTEVVEDEEELPEVPSEPVKVRGPTEETTELPDVPTRPVKERVAIREEPLTA
ncbi:hypothetical protein KFL_006560020 [Klebsormidium nitens]|uniref:Uncharacterized protein n=1 Tax=Klebsormidium nitens TaxID=105231 RepID=A0A1Y1IQZ5_KLENI|nr:hypothetical protein KFL_006560020 [Klebsormidium nitens]|eukprot:GAQ90558.1 hypothetical protein KFL_006560020 [Klebsormidium nitens]